MSVGFRSDPISLVANECTEVRRQARIVYWRRNMAYIFAFKFFGKWLQILVLLCSLVENCMKYFLMRRQCLISHND